MANIDKRELSQEKAAIRRMRKSGELRASLVTFAATVAARGEPWPDYFIEELIGGRFPDGWLGLIREASSSRAKAAADEAFLS